MTNSNQQFAKQASECIWMIENKVFQYGMEPENVPLLDEIKSSFQELAQIANSSPVGDFAQVATTILNIIHLMTADAQFRQVEHADFIVESVENIKMFIESMASGGQPIINVDDYLNYYQNLQAQAPHIPMQTAENTSSQNMDGEKLPERPDDVDDELLEDFKEETAEHMEVIEQSLEQIAQGNATQQIFHDMFGPMHSIKGGANYLGLSNTGKLAYSMETLVGKLRKSEIEINESIIHALNAGFGLIKNIFVEINELGWERTSTQSMVDLIEYATTHKRLPEDASIESATPAPITEPAESVEPAFENLDQEVPGPPDDVDEELLEDFKEETQEHLDVVETSLLELEHNIEDKQLIHTIFGSMHSIKGGANYLGLINIGTLAHSLESLLAKVRKGEIEPSTEIIEVLLRGVDFIKKLVAEVVNEGWEKSHSGNLV